MKQLSQFTMRFERPEKGDVPALSPETTSIPVLIEALHEIDSATRAYAPSELASIKELPIITLAEITHSSLGVGLRSAEQYQPYIEAFANDFEHQNWDMMPMKAFLSVAKLYKTTKKLGAKLHIQFQEHSIYILPSDPPPKRMAARATGTLALAGQIIQSGGAKPAIDFRMDKDNQIIHGIKVSEEMAKKLGNRLYTPVILRGYATWNTESWEIEEFEFNEVLEADFTEAEIGLARMRKYLSNVWDDVDVEAYMQDVRGG